MQSLQFRGSVSLEEVRRDDESTADIRRNRHLRPLRRVGNSQTKRTILRPIPREGDMLSGLVTLMEDCHWFQTGYQDGRNCMVLHGCPSQEGELGLRIDLEEILVTS